MKLYVPAPVAVPDIVPFVLRLRPGGRVPAVIAHKKLGDPHVPFDPTPPEALSD